MTLLAPWWILAAATTLVVIALHRRKRSSSAVSSLYIWRRVVEASPVASRRVARANIHLLLQFMTVSLLVLALAEPILAMRQGGLEHRVIVVDGSVGMRASLGAESTMDRARRHAQGIVDTAPAGTQFSVVEASAGGYVRLARSRDAALVSSVIDDVVATDLAVDWDSVAGKVKGTLLANERATVTVLSGVDDGRARTVLMASMPSASIEVRGFGGYRTNVGVTRAQLDPLPSDDGNVWQLQGVVHNYGAVPAVVDAVVQFQPSDGALWLPWDTITLDLESGASDSFSKRVQLPGEGRLRLVLAEDDLSSDNSANFVVSRGPITARVLLVGQTDSALDRVFAALRDVEVHRVESLPSSSADYDLVVIEGVPTARQPQTSTLWIGASPQGDSLEAMLDPNIVREREFAPLFAGVDWHGLEVVQAVRIPRLTGALSLLEASEGPLIQARMSEQGLDVVLSFPIDGSNWASLPSFVVFMSNLVDIVQPYRGSRVGIGCVAGSPCPLPLRLARPTWSLRPRGSSEERGYLDASQPLSAPQIGSTPSATLLTLPSFRPAVAGFYELVSATGSTDIAVNAFSSTPSADAESAGADVPTPKSVVPVWKWLVLASFLTLAVEAAIAVVRSVLDAPVPRPARWLLRARAYITPAALTLCAAALLVAAGLQQPPGMRALPPSAVLVVDDLRAYDPRTRERIESLLLEIAGSSSDRARVAVVEAAGESRVVADDAATLEPAQLSADGPLGSDLASAVDIAAALLVGSERGRIILVSSGAETRGDIVAAIERTVAQGVPVDVVPLPAVPVGEVLVESLDLPEVVRAGSSFVVAATVFRADPGWTTVQLQRNGEVVDESRQLLAAGTHRIDFHQSAESVGDDFFVVRLLANDDGFSLNDQIGGYVRVTAPGRILIVASEVGEGTLLSEALELKGFVADVVEVADVPWTIEGLLGYDVIVLANVPAIELQPRRQSLLAEFVRDHGGGLVIAGGPRAFGPGGYYQTPLEEVSPLSSRFPREAPVAAMAFVLDRSGSMQQLVGSTTRLGLAIEATKQAIDLLSDRSEVAIIAFDSEASALVPLQTLADRPAIELALSALRPAGGTAVYPALELTLQQLASTDASTVHAVVMSDGLSQPGDAEGILARFREAEISVSAVAIGTGANVEQLRSIASLGEGVFHQSADFASLPSILAQEAMLLSGSPVDERTFVPAWSDRRPGYVQGLPDELPELHGYVLTTPKDPATVALVGPDGDPIIASWQYGLGRVLAFTSQVAGAWSRDFVASDVFPQLWSQIVRDALPFALMPGVHASLEPEGDNLRVRVVALAEDGSADVGRAFDAQITGPNSGTSTTIRLEEVVPGRLEAELALDAVGTYSVRILPQGSDGPDAIGEGVSLTYFNSYPARLAFSRIDSRMVTDIANATGGDVILDAGSLTGPVRSARVWLPAAWKQLVLLALAMFLAGLVARYASHALAYRTAWMRRIVQRAVGAASR